jgi:hypothetical protein
MVKEEQTWRVVDPAMLCNSKVFRVDAERRGVV